MLSQKNEIQTVVALCLVFGSAPLLPGCASIVASATDRLAGNITTAILNQDDPVTVQQGAPAYLLMIDGLIEGDPENTKLLLAGARLYGSYASVFVDDKQRAQRLSDKAWGYSLRALCQTHSQACGMHQRPYEEYVKHLAHFNRSDADVLYVFATTWVGWIQIRQENWNAIADIPKVKASLEHVLSLNEAHDQGGAHLYLGSLATLLPPALGGKPKQAQKHFDRAIALSNGHNFVVKVLYAERYARMMFDRALHDRLLREVLSSDPRAPGYTLMNVVAQQKARILLDSAGDYF